MSSAIDSPAHSARLRRAGEKFRERHEMAVADESNAPFGGVGASGTGSRFGGPAANIEAFTETQWVTVRPEAARYPF